MEKSQDLYQKFALIYDHMLKHVDYFMWADYIYNLSVIHDVHIKTMLDLACGTGKLIEEMLAHDVKCVGLDMSMPMLELAKKRLDGQTIELIQADMTSFQSDKQYDVITCLFDSINYLNNEERLIDFFNHVALYLNSNGLFIFDAVSEKQCINHYFDYTENDSFDGIQYERRSRYKINQHIQNTIFKFTIDGEVFSEEHNQYIYAYDFIITAIEKSSLSFEAAYADFTFESVDKDTERFHFVCKKI